MEEFEFVYNAGEFIYICSSEEFVCQLTGTCYFSTQAKTPFIITPVEFKCGRLLWGIYLLWLHEINTKPKLFDTEKTLEIVKKRH